MLRPGLANKLEQFVAWGGTFLTTFFSGIVDENDHVVLGGYPGELRKLLGVYVEEFDPWIEGMANEVIVREGQLQGTYSCTLWGEVVHLEGASALGVFGKDYYAGRPALTLHQFGKGKAYYLATQGNEELLSSLIDLLCQEANVEPLLGIEGSLEVSQRQRVDGSKIYFLLNYGEKPVEMTLPDTKFPSLLSGEELRGSIDIATHDVIILHEEKDALIEGI